MHNYLQKHPVANLFMMIATCIVLASCSRGKALLTASVEPTLAAVEFQNTPISTAELTSQSISVESPEILDNVPKDMKVYGTALIEGYTGNPSYFLNLQDKSTTSMPTGFSGAKVAPDGKTLAYFENVEGNKLNLVVTSDYVNYEVVSWKEEWKLDGVGVDGNLFIEKKQDTSLPSYMIFDPRTKRTNEILPDYPDIETTYYSPEWWFPAYSPNGNEVVYPRVNSNSRIALWNRAKEQVIASLTSINNPYGLQPVWSSDGKHFVMALENKYLETLDYPSHELYLVEQDGKTKQLTHLTNYYKDTVRIGSYSWSPDNSRVAFQLMYQDKGQLAVVDTRTNEVKVYNLPGSFVHHQPVWSPDGKSILIDGYFEDSQDYWTVLIDLDKNRAIKIVPGSFPVGWVSFTS